MTEPGSPIVAPKLLDRVRASARLRYLALSTEKAYVHWAKRYVLFHRKRHPQEMGEREVNEFLTHLAVREHVAASTQNQALAGLLFLYYKVLGRPLNELEGVVRARRPKRLPAVLTPDEVQRVLACLSGERWLIGMLLYGAGLRLLEALRLRVKDVDIDKAELTIREAKGNKDRVTVLPDCVREPLSRYLESRHQAHGSELEEGRGRVMLPTPLPVSTRRQSSRGLGSGCLRRRRTSGIVRPDGCIDIIFTRRSCRGQFERLSSRPRSSSGRAAICSGIHSLRISSRTATTSARCRNCWGTTM
jgi:integrase